MKTEQAELATVPKEVNLDIQASPANMILQAVKGGADLDKLEKLLGIQERYEANEARKAYHQAMSAFKANPPKIEKDKKVSFKETRYSHASLSNVTRKINAGLSEHGLSASWIVKQDGAISVTCRITHVQGHYEETTMSAPADSSGSKNAIQAIGSTISYLERYTLLALTGLATDDSDDDGKGAGAELISPEDAESLRNALKILESSEQKFCEYMKIEKLENMAKSDLQKAKIAIDNVRKKKGAAVDR